MEKNEDSYSLNINIDVCLHLDHGSSIESCKKAIDAGFSSVMIDASKYSLDENINITQEVVKYAHDKNVTVEAEIGTLAGVEDEVNVSEEHAIYTKPEEALKFATETGVDSLAIAIGTSHGAYKFKGEAKLRYDILNEITKVLPETPIVLHGASSVIPELVNTANEFGAKIPGAKGMPNDMLNRAAKEGVSKINVDTDLRLAMTSEIRKYFVEHPEAIDLRAYMGAGKQKIKEIVKDKMRNVFMSSNKA